MLTWNTSSSSEKMISKFVHQDFLYERIKLTNKKKEIIAPAIITIEIIVLELIFNLIIVRLPGIILYMIMNF